MSQKTDRLTEVADESTNIVMDYLRDTHGIDPDTDLDDLLYTHIHKYIERMVHHTTTVILKHKLRGHAQES